MYLRFPAVGNAGVSDNKHLPSVIVRDSIPVRLIRYSWVMDFIFRDDFHAFFQRQNRLVTLRQDRAEKERADKDDVLHFQLAFLKK